MPCQRPCNAPESVKVTHAQQAQTQHHGPRPHSVENQGPHLAHHGEGLKPCSAFEHLCDRAAAPAAAPAPAAAGAHRSHLSSARPARARRRHAASPALPHERAALLAAAAGASAVRARGGGRAARSGACERVPQLLHRGHRRPELLRRSGASIWPAHGAAGGPVSGETEGSQMVARSDSCLRSRGGAA